MASSIRLTRALKVVELSTIGLARLGLKRRDVIDTDRVHYTTSRALAAELHARTDAEGLIWTSRLDDQNRAVVLLGDRLMPSDLEPVQGPESLRAGESEA